MEWWRKSKKKQKRPFEGQTGDCIFAKEPIKSANTHFFLEFLYICSKQRIFASLAILADIITWIYEVAWIIPIILVIVVGFFVWRKSMLRKKMKIKQLVKAALMDGKLSDKEKQTILSKARKHGMDSGEAEIYLEAIIHQIVIKKNRK